MRFEHGFFSHEILTILVPGRGKMEEVKQMANEQDNLSVGKWSLIRLENTRFFDIDVISPKHGFEDKAFRNWWSDDFVTWRISQGVFTGAF